jgi:hypothetical protein
VFYSAKCLILFDTLSDMLVVLAGSRSFSWAGPQVLRRSLSVFLLSERFLVIHLSLFSMPQMALEQK